MIVRNSSLAAALLLASISVATAHTPVNPDRSADRLNQQVLDVITPRAAQPLPTPPVPPSSAAVRLTGMYVGGVVGTNFQDNTDYTLGAVVGNQFHRNLAVEVTYDYMRLGNANEMRDGQMVMANVVAARSFSNADVTPYLLAGAGVGWNGMGELGTGLNLALYNVGGGLRVALTPGIELDARYRYVGAFDDTGDGNSHLLSGGVNFRF